MGEDLKRADLLNLAFLTHPNLIVELNEAVAHGRKQVRSLAHRLDDPDAFKAAVDAVRSQAADTNSTIDHA